MKTFVTSVLLAFFIFLLFYLLGAFIETELNIKKWNPATREFIALFGGLLSLFLSVSYFTFNKID